MSSEEETRRAELIRKSEGGFHFTRNLVNVEVTEKTSSELLFKNLAYVSKSHMRNNNVNINVI